MRFTLPFFLIVVGITLLFGKASPALATEYFVKTDGDDTAAGTNWATAFLTISNAVAQTTDDDTVTVSNGTYTLAAQIYITNGITVQSLNGITNTTVNGGGSTRIFYLNHASAVVDGFTITNGYINASGGGVYMNGGTVQNCLITKCQAVNSYGSGVYIISGGIVSNCSIIKNSGGKWGGGVTIYQSGTVKDSTISGNSCMYNAGGVYINNGGLVRNCLITGNSAAGPGGVYLVSAGTVESCTISRNSASTPSGGAPGGGVGGSGGTIKNTIIYFNTATPGGWGDNWASGPSYSYNCTTPAVGGTSNITDDPLFVNYTNDNYRLRPGSPCIDAGQSNSWMAGAKDLDGNDRIIGSTVDIGAYEFKEGDLMCGFAADSLEGFDPHTVVFTGYVSGTNLTGFCYLWDVDNNGSVDYDGPTVSVVTNTYTSGVYAVSLTVTNAVGETNTYTRENYIKSGPTTGYVDVASASPGFPYATWATAATNIQASVNAGVDGTLVLVTDGTYVLSSQVSISRGITVRSVNGHSATIVDGNGSVRGFSINDVNAVVDGFTIQNCSVGGGGGGVYLNGVGLAQNCAIISNNSTANYGGGAYMLSGGTLRNCLVMGNYGKYTGGVALHYSGPTVESCTIVSNRASLTDYPGGVYCMWGGTVRNTIIYDNSAVGSYTNWRKTGGTITYTDTTPAAGGTGNITDDPAFKNANVGNYRLRTGPGGSPCINAGTFQAWMTGAADLDGYNRIVNGTVDMGAYESFIRGMIIKIH